MQSTVTCPSTDYRPIQRKSIEKAEQRTKYHDYHKATSTTALSAQLAAVYEFSVILQMGVSPRPRPGLPLCTHSYCGVHICDFTLNVHVCVGVCVARKLKHNVLQALAAGRLLVPAIAEERVDLPDRRLTVLPLRLPEQAVVSDPLRVAALQRVVSGHRLGHGALQMHRGGDGAGRLAPVAGFAHGSSVGLGAAHLRLLSPLPLKLAPLHVLGPILAEGGKSSLGGAILIVGHIHRGGLDGQSNYIPGVLG